MKNILRKSWMMVIGCLMAVEVFATDVVALAPGTYSLTSAAATSGSKKFNMNQNIYYGRNGGGLAGNNGVEVKSGSMFAFKIKDPSTVKFKVRNSKTKSITDTWDVKAISDADFAGIVAQYDAGGNASTYYSNSNAKIVALTVTHTGTTETYTNETSALQPGCYGFYLSSHSADGDFIPEIVITGTAPVISTDATLSALTYNGISVPNFSANTLSYEVELPTGTTTVPTVAATKNESHATVNVTPATALPGTTTIDVTAQDGTTTKQYTITFTVASAAPKVLTATWANIQGTATVDNVNMTITGQVKNGTGLTAITPSFTGNNIASWSPQGAIDFSNGAVDFEFSSSAGPMTTYTITITEAPAMSTDATLSSLKYGNKAVPGFAASTYTYNIELEAGTTTAPTLSATKNESHATIEYAQASGVPGVGKVKVTAEDGTTTLTYTVNFTVAVPQSDLTIHVPEVYEAKELAGGYNTPLVNYNQREYEVFYLGKSKPAGASGDIAVTYTLNHKGGYLVSSPSGSGTSMTAKDGWFKATISSLEGSFKEASEIAAKASARDEFADLPGDLKMKNNNTFELHIQGYDQFSIVAQDKKKDTKGTTPADNRYWEVYIDGSLQPQYFDKDNATTRRYDITTGRHVISLKAIGSEDSKLYGFSLRLAQEPRTKWLKGNDSTQVVMQTAAIKPVTYVTKYNNIPGVQTRLIWIGAEAKGIGMSIVEGTLTDTILVSGTANCATGVYNYAVVSYYNGIETSRATGKFTVKSDIQATSEINVDVYAGEEMDQITFKYFALSADDVQLTWDNNQPTGVTGSGSNGKYIIGGTPTVTGTFPYAITVTGADTVIHGTITVNTLDYGDNAVLYLYKNHLAYEHDGVYQYIKGTHNWNLIARKQKEDGLRPADQYANYKWILISEDVDADNTEVLAVIRGDANLPVLNLKGFAYSSDRLGWGEPDNGAIDSTAVKNNGCKLYVQHPNHPIYTAKMNYLKAGDSIQVLSDYTVKGLMPINIDVPESYCLGTAYTRNIDDYYSRGEKQTALHEIPAAKHNGKKYICLPLAREVTLASQGQQLIEGIIRYLMSADASGVTLPELKINTFSVAGVNAEIDQIENTILLSISKELYDSLKTAEPVITLADPNTHVNTSSTALEYAVYLPKTYVVTDYINRRAYSLTIEIYDPQGIDEVYEAGMWVNVFDIYGRKVTTTNEDIYTMDLPKGMYIIVTESGQTLKIMR